MIKSINSRFDPNWIEHYENHMILNPRRFIFWFELFHNAVLFRYRPEIPDALSDELVITIKNPSRDQILRIIDGKDIYVDGADLRYLVEHYICKDLVVPAI